VAPLVVKEPGQNKSCLLTGDELEHQTSALSNNDEEKQHLAASKAKRPRTHHPTVAARTDWSAAPAPAEASAHKCDNCGKLYASEAFLRNHLKGKLCQNGNGAENLNVNKLHPSSTGYSGSGGEFLSLAIAYFARET